MSAYFCEQYCFLTNCPVDQMTENTLEQNFHCSTVCTITNFPALKQTQPDGHTQTYLQISRPIYTDLNGLEKCMSLLGYAIRSRTQALSCLYACVCTRDLQLSKSAEKLASADWPLFFTYLVFYLHIFFGESIIYPRLQFILTVFIYLYFLLGAYVVCQK